MPYAFAHLSAIAEMVRTRVHNANGAYSLSDGAVSMLPSRGGSKPDAKK
ncbi:Uncharacterised protein [uncultured Blautia sp.]|nr:Uncharacterised protein [uncultured Blautia sp.]